MSYITRDSEWWVSQFMAARVLRAPLTSEGLRQWPAREVDAFLLLETETQLQNQNV